MEPGTGKFNFDWLDRAIELLAGEGIATVLGTPTAAPPAHPPLPSFFEVLQSLVLWELAW